MFGHKLKHLFVGISLFAVCHSSFAIFGIGDIVFDPTNWLQTNATAIAAVKSEINTYRSYLGQLIQIKNEIRNLKEMGVAGVAARALDVEDEIRSIKALRDASQNLYSSLQGSGDYVQGIQRMINVSALTADQWLDREKKLVKKKDANATYLMKTGESIITTVENAQKQRDKVLSDNDFNGGIRETAQKTNVMLGNLSALQSQQLMAMKADMEVRSQAIALDANEKAAKEGEDRKFINDRIKAQERAASFD